MGCEEGLARSLVCAAVREVFEECGVLLAGPSPETVVADLRDPEWDAERSALLSKEQSFAELLLRRGLVLRSDLLSPQGRWVTPDFEPRRYDTFFFAALLPEGQIPDDDTSEADHADWTDPAELLAAYEIGRGDPAAADRGVGRAGPGSGERGRARRDREAVAGGRPRRSSRWPASR